MFTIIAIEFTGGRSKQDHIVELAMLKHNGTTVVASFHRIIRPDSTLPLSHFTTALYTFTEVELLSAPLFSDLHLEIAAFTENTILVGLAIRRSYALLKQSFKRCAYRFLRQQIALNQLIEPYFSPQTKQSFAAVCQHFSLPFSPTAGLLSQANAVAAVFEKLLLAQGLPINPQKIRHLVINTKYPPNLSHHKVDSLPNTVGVYYFLDQRGRIIYLGKSKTIRTRILSHFNSDLESKHKHDMKALIYDINYRLTGSELIALLLESDEIKRFMPIYNKAQRRKRYVYGVYMRSNPEGYHCLHISTLSDVEHPIQQFTTRLEALQFILYAAHRYSISLVWCAIPKPEQWYARIGLSVDDFNTEEDNVTIHNSKVAQLRQFYHYPSPNMLLVEAGRSVEELSVVYIADNRYLGYAYIPLEEWDVVTNQSFMQQVALVEEHLIPFRDTPDVQQIICGYLRQHKVSLGIIIG